MDTDHVAILDSVPVGTPQIAGVPESLHFWLQRTRMLPPQEIYAVTDGCAREKIRQRMQNDDNGHGGDLPATIRRANLDGPGVAEQNLGRYCRLTRQIRRRAPHAVMRMPDRVGVRTLQPITSRYLIHCMAQDRIHIHIDLICQFW